MTIPNLTEIMVDAIVERLAERIKPMLAQSTQPAGSPWMTTEEAATYTRMGTSTFRRRAAAGEIPSHQLEENGKHFFHRAELDAFLGYEPGDASAIVPLRKAS